MIPVFTLSRQNKIIGEELQKAIKEVIGGGVYILGPKVAEFEEEFANYLNVKYAVGVASGTDALSLGLLAVGVGAGDEVILPANCYPTVFAISAIGAVPKLVDIDPVSFNIDPTKILPAITKKTKAIIAVHLYGQPADLTSVRQCLKEVGRKIFLIEDCAQSHGAEIKQSSKFKVQSSKLQREKNGWIKTGAIGDVGCFSFYPTKNLGCFGDGGVVVTNNEEIYRKVKLLRMYGEEKRYKSIALGRNSRLDELQAAILLVKLKYLDEWNNRRCALAYKYQKIIQNSKFKIQNYNSKLKNYLDNLQLPQETPYTKHTYHLFVIRTKKRDELRNYLEKKGIGTAIHYPSPIHLQPSFKFLGYKQGDFPQSEKACEGILSLPMFPELEDQEVGRVVKAIIDFYSN